MRPSKASLDFANEHFDFDQATPDHFERKAALLDAHKADLLAAAKRALSLLEYIGTGKWAKTQSGDDLRAAIQRHSPQEES